MRDFFEKALQISDEDVIRTLLAVEKQVSLKKGTRLLEAGSCQTHLIFVLTGILRGFLLDENGRDITDSFACRWGDPLLCGNDFFGPSQVDVEALSDCQLLALPLGAVQPLLSRGSLLPVYNRLLRDALTAEREEKRALYFPAIQRYRWFLEAYPGLIHKVSNRHIASFLGMTPVTLSRVRSQLRREQAGAD